MEVENRVGAPRRIREVPRPQEADETSIQPRTINRIGIMAAIALGAFLLGFIPMWLTSRGAENELEAVAKTLRPSVLQNNLATATINARRGEFEQARLQTSSFFTDLRAEVERSESAFGADQQEGVRAILEQRDETITLLARANPAGADRLTDLYFNYLQVKNSSVSINK